MEIGSTASAVSYPLGMWGSWSGYEQHIAEAQREYLAIKKTVMLLAEKVLEEQWNEEAQGLMEKGAKLWAVKRMLGDDQISLRRLVLPKEGEDFHAWGSRELAERSYKYNEQDVLTL
ncbi:hypothetical protein FQ192_28835 [Pseudomonas sp. ANT_J12]|nr:hypothetical protein FQ192_28835 [Pseudomonas sp. ANT_J12]